jgi:hypothetical protein
VEGLGEINAEMSVAAGPVNSGMSTHSQIHTLIIWSSSKVDQLGGKTIEQTYDNLLYSLHEAQKS